MRGALHDKNKYIRELIGEHAHLDEHGLHGAVLVGEALVALAEPVGAVARAAAGGRVAGAGAALRGRDGARAVAEAEPATAERCHYTRK